MTTTTIDITVLVADTNGEKLLWLETGAEGNTTLNDHNMSVPFDPIEEDIEAVVADWIWTDGGKFYREYAQRDWNGEPMDMWKRVGSE